MPASPPSPSSQSPTAPAGRRAVVVLALFLAGVTACLFLYLTLAATGSWRSAAPSRQWSAREFTVKRGIAQLSPEGLVITAPDATRTVVISLDTELRARDYPLIAWEASNIPGSVQATLFWYSDVDSTRVFQRNLAREGGHLAPIVLAQDRGWLGRIGGLALVLHGDFSEPIMVRSVTAKTLSPRQVLGDRVREWLAFEPWNGASVNNLSGGADVQELPLPAFLAAAAALAALAYAGLARLKPVVFGPVLGAGVASIFVVAWLGLDARWQWNLAQQAFSTHAQYAGKSWRERHLAAEDASLFAFIEKVRAKLPGSSARVFMAAGADYFRDRGAYHLYPNNVYFDPWSDTMPPPSSVRSGDYVIVYLRQGVQYKNEAQQLRWDNLQPIAADLVLNDPGAALFRVR
jgi:hypothetical protein